ncbi:phage tail tube protein [Brevundimonas subvibrioides]|uniref:Uncharacterized protein n=1 Tax=Brevundimonas subvibrioides (strain ATCC 15264 / DSM 4735 / LMG 14903 / NBRC 16000 / CB 81) TaxID=633149 RepID=D9QFY5_BRESC|nr:phage tail tube protein [Brevundimonas subvibrioides]ADL00699.1 hypothetical protein Bresu_1387 [Brevundimonas subvibrioides ATCC 15264]
MPTDIWYGADCETRIGKRANATTPPTTWQSVEFMSLTVNPTQEWRDRPKLGNPAARVNTLDPIKPRKGFYRESAEVVLDADTRSLPLWLRHAMGSPTTTTASALFLHTFASGAKTEQYFDIVVKVGASDFRIYQGLTLSQLSIQNTGENTQDFNINLSLLGLSRAKATSWPTGTVTACPAEAPILRAIFSVDNVAAGNMLSSSLSWDRQLQEGVFLSAAPTVSSLRPNGGSHSGSATFRAIGAVFDTMEEADTVFSAQLNYYGVVADHFIRFEHATALLQPSPLPISGPGTIERTLNWAPFQTGSTPALTIAIVNDVTAYA